MHVAQPSDETVDRDCVARMALGDVAALRRLYETHVGRVFGFARRMLGDEHEAEDVVQEVFVRAWHKAGEYDHRRASPWGWLAMMTRSLCLDRLRRRRRRPDLAGAASLEQLGAVFDAADPVRRVGQGGDVTALLETVRPVERTCLAHVFFDGLTVAETASRTGLPLGSVKTHIRRALQRLREALSPHDS